MTPVSRRFGVLTILLLVVAGVIFLWRIGRKGAAGTAGGEVSEAAVPAVAPESSAATADGHLQRSAPTPKAAPLESDEIKKKSGELFARFLEVGKTIQNGDYQTALETLVEYYAWTRENDYAPSAGVRASFGLSDWRQLIAAYPPAADKLREMADDLEETMRTVPMAEVAFDPRAVFSEFPQEVRDSFVAQALMRDLCNFNDVLGTPERSMDLLVDLAKEEPELVISCWRGAEDMLYEAKAYDVLQVCIPDLQAEHERVVDTLQRVADHSLQMMQEKFKDNPAMQEMNRKASQASLEKFAAQRIGRLLEFGVATGQAELVSELAAQTIERFPGTAEKLEKYQQPAGQE